MPSAGRGGNVARQTRARQTVGDGADGATPSAPPATPVIEDRDDNSRLLALSDGVFAIALTILVLDLRLPAGLTDLPAAVGNLWPKFLSYLISFLVIAIFWMAHHRTFRTIAGHDAAVLWFNIFFLLCIGFLPFPVSLVGKYHTDRFAVILYDLTMIATSLPLSLMLLHARRNPDLCATGARPEHFRHGLLRGAVVPAVMGVSIAVSFINVAAAQYAWLLIIAGQLAVARVAPMTT